MFLTRITVRREEAIRRRLVDAYAWHRALWTAFPGRDDADRDFLSRTDDLRGGQRTLLLSPAPPEAPGWGRWETKQIVESFLDHDRYLFDLRANPVVSRPAEPVTSGQRPRGRRTPLLDENDLTAWMRRKAGAAGFDVQPGQLEVGVPIRQPFTKCNRSGMHTRVDFRGVLDVRDREAFRIAFRTGIGPAKAFGFGLLMLRPLPPTS